MRRYVALFLAVWPQRGWPRHAEIDARIQSQGYAIPCRGAEASTGRVLLLAHAGRRNDSRFEAALAAIRRLDSEESRERIRASAKRSLRGRYCHEGLFVELKRKLLARLARPGRRA